MERGARSPPSGGENALFVTRTTSDDGWVVRGGSGAAGSVRQVVWMTTDGGRTWRDLGPAMTGNVLLVADVSFVSDANGFALVLRGNFSSRLISSADGGASWSGVSDSPWPRSPDAGTRTMASGPFWQRSLRSPGPWSSLVDSP